MSTGLPLASQAALERRLTEGMMEGAAVEEPQPRPASPPAAEEAVGAGGEGGSERGGDGAAPPNASASSSSSPSAAPSQQPEPSSRHQHAATQTEPPALTAWQRQRLAAAIRAGRALQPGAAPPSHLLEQIDPKAATAAVMAIQRHTRGWLVRRRVTALRAALHAEQEGAAAAAETERQYEMQRRMQPRTPADFLLLYDELAQWWGQEQAKIAGAQGLTDEERQAARQALLAKETRLLQTIDRLKVAATPSVRAERAVRQLATAAAPRDWQLGEGGAVEVTTPATLRAGELAATHAALVADDGRSLDARLAALLAAKFYAKEVDCSLTREIVSLVDREADLLNRGRDPDSLAGLRQRLANRFLEFALSRASEGDVKAAASAPSGRVAAAAAVQMA